MATWRGCHPYCRTLVGHPKASIESVATIIELELTPNLLVGAMRRSNVRSVCCRGVALVGMPWGSPAAPRKECVTADSARKKSLEFLGMQTTVVDH